MLPIFFFPERERSLREQELTSMYCIILSRSRRREEELTVLSLWQSVIFSSRRRRSREKFVSLSVGLVTAGHKAVRLQSRHVIASRIGGEDERNNSFPRLLLFSE